MEGLWFATSCSSMKEKNEQELNVNGDQETVSPLEIGRHLVGEDFELLLGEEMVFVSVMIIFSCK